LRYDSVRLERAGPAAGGARSEPRHAGPADRAGYEEENPMSNGGFGGLGDMGGLMKQAQKMQKDMERIKSQLNEMVVEASSGGGVVTVNANGAREVLAIKIKPEAVDPDDLEMLEDLVQSAVNAALTKAQEMADKEMAKLTGGLNLPGMFG
jgi:DNA-binding YbaB/EbfC family protein